MTPKPDIEDRIGDAAGRVMASSPEATAVLEWERRHPVLALLVGLAIMFLLGFVVGRLVP